MEAKFGVQIPQENLTYEEMSDLLKNVENLGFYSFLIYDHLQPTWRNSSEKAIILENWVLLSALSRETSKIKIGIMVNCNGFRYPAVLAKMAASLDVISGGRLEFMIGAGHNLNEHRGYGLTFPKPMVRIGQLKEAIEIIKLFWTEDKVYYKGKYYQIDGGVCYPKPLQKPYPRIWVGGGGEKYTLRTVAEVGGGSNFFGTVKDFERKLNLLRKYCQDVGRDYNSIPKSWYGDLLIGKGEGEVKSGMKRLEAKVPKPERILRALIGTPPQIIDQIEEYVKLGVEYFIVVPTDPKDIDSMRLFAEKVVPSFK